jgi:hypothetical protein
MQLIIQFCILKHFTYSEFYYVGLRQTWEGDERKVLEGYDGPVCS